MLKNAHGRQNIFVWDKVAVGGKSRNSQAFVFIFIYFCTGLQAVGGCLLGQNINLYDDLLSNDKEIANKTYSPDVPSIILQDVHKHE